MYKIETKIKIGTWSLTNENILINDLRLTVLVLMGVFIT